MNSDVWGQVREELKGNLSSSSYSSWIAPLEWKGLGDQVASFEVPTGFIGNYVNQNFGDQILYELNKAGQDVQRLRFDVPAGKKPAAAARTTQ